MTSDIREKVADAIGIACIQPVRELPDGTRIVKNLDRQICLAAADAALAACGHQEWQDIETAPKDGTRILVHFWEPSQTLVAYFVDYDPFCWQAVSGERWNAKHASHWLPLPSPPKARGTP